MDGFMAWTTPYAFWASPANAPTATCVNLPTLPPCYWTTCHYHPFHSPHLTTTSLAFPSCASFLPSLPAAYGCTSSSFTLCPLHTPLHTLLYTHCLFFGRRRGHCMLLPDSFILTTTHPPPSPPHTHHTTHPTHCCMDDFLHSGSGHGIMPSWFLGHVVVHGLEPVLAFTIPHACHLYLPSTGDNIPTVRPTCGTTLPGR